MYDRLIYTHTQHCQWEIVFVSIHFPKHKECISLPSLILTCHNGQVRALLPIGWCGMCDVIWYFRFTKNLSADKINVSTLRGEGELYNLELNVELLTELLELPTWLKISHAKVNRVSLRIPWTKLKNVPIVLVSSTYWCINPNIPARNRDLKSMCGLHFLIWIFLVSPLFCYICHTNFRLQARFSFLGVSRVWCKIFP